MDRVTGNTGSCTFRKGAVMIAFIIARVEECKPQMMIRTHSDNAVAVRKEFNAMKKNYKNNNDCVVIKEEPNYISLMSNGYKREYWYFDSP